jgi:hypothetical protein
MLASTRESGQAFAHRRIEAFNISSLKAAKDSIKASYQS